MTDVSTDPLDFGAEEPRNPGPASGTYPTQSEPWWKAALPVAAVILFSVVLRSGIVSIPLERDEGEYAYIADRWLAGDVPYRDIFDQKTPAVFAIYAGLFAMGLRSTEAIHWLGHGALVGTVVFLYLLGRRLFSHQVGWIAGLFAVLLIMNANVYGNAANTEVFAILPLTAGLYFAVRAASSGCIWDGLLTGICGGLALSCKQVTLPVAVFSVVWVLYEQVARTRGMLGSQHAESPHTPLLSSSTTRSRPLALAGSLVLGFIVVLAPTCLYFAMRGAWSSFFDCVVAHNMAYGGRVPLRYYGSNFWETSKFQYLVFAPIFAVVFVGLLLAWQRGVTGMRFCTWWLLASFLCTSAGGYYRNHYFILLMPPLALIAAYGVEALAVFLEPRRQTSQRWITVTLWVVALIWPLYMHHNYYWPPSLEIVCRRLYGPNPFPESPALGKLIRENSQPDDRVFIFGSEPQILFFAERVSASRYIFMYPLFATAHSITRQQEVMEELRRHPPQFVLLVDPIVVRGSFLLSVESPQYLFNAISELIKGDYVPFAASLLRSDGTARTAWPAYNEGELDFAPEPGEVITIRIFQRRESEKQKHQDPPERDMKSVQSQLEHNLSDVRGRIERAARESGRSHDAVRLVAVTKTVDARVASELIDLGVTDLAESRPQELWRKHHLLTGPLHWHLVGPLQKNKVRRTLPIVQLIHSVDSLSLLSRLDELAAELDLHPAVLLEVNVSGEATKHGFSPHELPSIIAGAADLARVQIRGLMTMAPQDASPESARPFFAALRVLRDRLAGSAPPQCRLTELSMGMSDDFEVAVAEGATIVRIGSALFRDIGGQT